jgi:uncharacterized protein YggE
MMNRIIDISATGSLTLNPDAVTVSFSVMEYDEAYKVVQYRLNKRVKEFRKLVESAGFKREDLVSDRYEIEQQYRYDKKDNRHPRGFKGEHKLSIKFELDQDLLDKLLRTLHPALEGIPYKVSFGLMNREAYKNQVIDIAVKKAISEAEQLVKSAGVKLGPIVKLNYGERDYPPMYAYEADLSPRAAMDPMNEYINPEFEPGEMSLHQTVYMQWEIVD